MIKARRSIENEVLKYLSQDIRNIITKIDPGWINGIEEIRMRVNKPLMLHNSKGDWFVDIYGNPAASSENPYLVTKDDIVKSIELMSENSIYAFQEDIKNGFITLRGGHRVGIAGRAVLDNSGVRSIKDFSGLNIRISHEICGCSDKIMKYILKNNHEIFNTLLISPPQCGKTTMLRDIARNLSDGTAGFGFHGIKVGVIDERSEIASCYKGVPQNQIGIRTDVLDGCPKLVGMDIMLRSMSPQVIVTDEIGNQGDRDAVKRVINAGVKIITTAHGYNISELKSRQEVISLIDERVFERYVVLSNSEGPGTIEEIVDGKSMSVIYRRSEHVA